ncbi:MAG: TonB-dependent receptor [Longimonas sp.]|uniref:TonB-dependent receptor domain-containing protein n=1 Tax=Longimonas sp. TaxID=2039626 RepID=UPI003976E231
MRWILTWCLLAVLSAGGTVATAQSPISVDADAPLPEVLDRLRTRTSLDLVYADRLVRDRRTTCTYNGDRARDALRCALEDTGLEAERIRRNQYVLVAGTENASDTTAYEERRAALTGRVRDAKSGEPLPGANIVMRDMQAGTSTDRNGYFVLSSLPPGPYRVRISYLGYAATDTTLTAGGQTTSIALRPESLEAEGVVINDRLTSVAAQEPMAGRVEVALDQIDALPSLGESDLLTALQWTPGVRRSGILSGGLSVRGASTDQNLYLLEDAPIYHPWHAFSLISTFQTETLKRTTLYRSSFPVEHGGRLASVVDAQLKDGNRTEPEARAALSALSGRFYIESPLSSSTSFMVSGRQSYIDRIIGREHTVEQGGRRDTMRTGYVFYDTSAKLTTQFNDRNRLSVSYYHGRDEVDLRLPFDLSLDFSSWLRPTDLFFELDQGWSNRMVSMQYQSIVAPSVVINATGYYSGYRANEASFVQPTTAASLTSDYTVSVDDVGLKGDVSLHRSMAHQWKLGGQLSYLAFASTLTSEVQRTVTSTETQEQATSRRAVQLSGFAQHTWMPTPRLEVQTGARLSYFSSGQYLHVRPRISAQYIVHPQFLTLQGGLSGHVQSLHQMRDRFSLAYDLVSTRWVPADRTVRPAESWQATAGARSRPWRALLVQGNVYTRMSRHTLIPEDNTQTKDGLQGPGIELGALLGQYTPARERAFGAELELRWERTRWRIQQSASLSHTFVRAASQNDNRYRPADLDIPWSTRSAVTWQPGALEVTLAGTLRSGYPLSSPIARYQVGDGTDTEPTTFLYRPHVNNNRLPMYGRLDASVGYRFQALGAAWQARIHVHNALNYRNVVGRTYEAAEGGIMSSDQRGLPILPLFELQLSL